MIWKHFEDNGIDISYDDDVVKFISTKSIKTRTIPI